MKRKQGGSDEEDAPRCIACGAKDKEEGAERGAPAVAVVGHDTLKQGGDGGGDSTRCPPQTEIASMAEENDAGGSASGVTGSNIDGASLVLPALDIAGAAERKLILILGLDHTLLDSTGLDDLSAAEQAKGLTPDASGDLFRLDSDNNLGVLVKLRPFVRGFLEQASSMFEMHVYTLGRNPAYAKAAVDLLDPDGDYFGGRVVSRDGSTSTSSQGGANAKSLDVVIPGADPVAAVILDALDDDDTGVAESWAAHQDNLIPTDRYRYFASTCRKSRRRGHDIPPSLAEQGRDEMGDHDGSLGVALGVLKRVHQAFFFDDGHRRADVREVIREVRGQALQGCTVAFGYLEEEEEEEDSPLMWRLATQLGAVCRKDVEETVTHVVAEDPATRKAQWARENGKFLVNPGWVKAASFQWRRQDEEAFPVTATAMGVERRREDSLKEAYERFYGALGLINLKRQFQERRDRMD